MINGNNQYWQNAAMNIRKDNDEWKNAANIYPPPVLIEKSVTENGDYSAATDNADGYSSVKVEVPSAPTPETFEVGIETDGEIGSSVTTTKTHSETVAAINNGDNIDFTITIGGEPCDVICYGIFINNSTSVIIITIRILGTTAIIAWSGDGSLSEFEMPGYIIQ